MGSNVTTEKNTSDSEQMSNNLATQQKKSDSGQLNCNWQLNRRGVILDN